LRLRRRDRAGTEPRRAARPAHGRAGGPLRRGALVAVRPVDGRLQLSLCGRIRPACALAGRPASVPAVLDAGGAMTARHHSKTSDSKASDEAATTGDPAAPRTGSLDRRLPGDLPRDALIERMI